MRISIALCSLLAVTEAAPTPSLLGDFVTSIVHGLDKVVPKIAELPTALSPLASAVASLGATLQNDAKKHGTILGASQLVCNVIDDLRRFSHSISWTKPSKNFVNWKTYKANGVNVGAWLEIEQNYDTEWWSANVGDAFPDEWNWCGAVGFNVCGPKLEAHYSSWITTADIDKMVKLGINTIRIPTTYAAWVQVPGSQLYSGKQQQYLKTITQYAIDKGMHVIIGLHSLPGGVNSLGIGESFSHNAWFFNATNLDYSFRAIDSILSFIRNSGRTYGYTIAPINEASDNFAGFATPAGLTANGTDWINTYIKGTLTRIAKVDKRIPLMLQDSFFSEKYWSPFYDASTNLVIDSHIYFFAASGIYAQYVTPAICGQAKEIGQGDGKFPVFIGEWSLQVLYNNTLSYRKTLYDTQVYAYQQYASGSAFWNYKMLNTKDTVDGEGKLQDYWSWLGLANAGIVSASGVNSSYC